MEKKKTALKNSLLIKKKTAWAFRSGKQKTIKKCQRLSQKEERA